MREYPLTYFDGDQELEAWVVEPKNAQPGKTPVVMIAHMWSGRVPFVEDVARAMAAKGYIGFALDMYGKGKIGHSVDENMALMMPFMENRALMQRRMLLALKAARSLPVADKDRIAAIGYCFGGLCVQDLARVTDQVRGVCSIHGLMKKPDNIDQGLWKAMALFLHGDADPMVSLDDWLALREELNKAGCDWQKHDFGGVMHAFTNPEANDPELGTVYDPKADRRSQILLDQFLQECFQ